jgi:uncharacterized membrane protein
MKKYFLIFILLLFCSYLCIAEKANIRIQLTYPQTIKSDGKTSYSIFLENNENKALYDLELASFNDANLEISFDRIKINKIEPKENIKINVEINNHYKYYFSKDTFITFEISNNEYFNEYRYKFTIKPVENFWFLIMLSIILLLTILFAIIFLKLEKGEENVR